MLSEDSVIKLRSGAHMPLLGRGTWQLTKDTTGTIAYALELGYRMIDTACDYGSQPGIGEAVRRGIVTRKSIYLRSSSDGICSEGRCRCRRPIGRTTWMRTLLYSTSS